MSQAELIAAIKNVRGDIEHILTNAPGLRDELPYHVQIPSPAQSERRGQPKKLPTLERELQALEALRAWLHFRWVEVRREKALNDPGLEKLARAGLVSAPVKPAKRGRGRTKGKSPRADSLDFWTRIIEERQRHIGSPISRAEAIRQAQIIVDASFNTSTQPTLKGAPGKESRLYRHRKRKAAAE